MSFVMKPVEDQPELLAFQYDFELDAKALDAEQVVTELDDGDLVIEGMAAVFDGIDRQNENFTEGAFKRGIDAFMSGASRPLCFHHDRKAVLGKILELEEIEGKGLRMKA